jgi:predicted amidohydrolase YtcJ
MDESTTNPPGGLIARDASGKPTGLFIAEPNALILYSTIAQAPKLSFEDQLNSSRHYMRELNRFGVTSASDAGGGGQNFPDDYAVVRQLAESSQLTVRMAYSLFAQKPGEEMTDYTRWLDMTKPGEGNAMLRVNGAGENLVWSAADFENFLQPRPDLKPIMESELEQITRKLADANWPWRIHATYDETIGRFLDVFERVHRDHPIDKLGWFIAGSPSSTAWLTKRNTSFGVTVKRPCRPDRLCAPCSRWDFPSAAGPTGRGWPVIIHGPVFGGW